MTNKVTEILFGSASFLTCPPGSVSIPTIEVPPAGAITPICVDGEEESGTELWVVTDVCPIWADGGGGGGGGSESSSSSSSSSPSLEYLIRLTGDTVGEAPLESPITEIVNEVPLGQLTLDKLAPQEGPCVIGKTTPGLGYVVREPTTTYGMSLLVKPGAADLANELRPYLVQDAPTLHRTGLLDWKRFHKADLKYGNR